MFLRPNFCEVSGAELEAAWGSAIDGCTEGYQISQRKREKIEEVFGWMKTVGMLSKTRHRGVSRVGWMMGATLKICGKVANLYVVCRNCRHVAKPLSENVESQITRREPPFYIFDNPYLAFSQMP